MKNKFLYVAIALLMAFTAYGEPILLWPDTPPGPCEDGFKPYLDLFLLDGEESRGVVIVVPGGGYGGRAGHEGAPIAKRLNAAGFHAVVLQYRVSPNRHPAPLLDVNRAVRSVRHNASAWKVKPDHIAVLGFSAGGHLTASSGVHFDLVKSGVGDAIDDESARPDALVLCYPVISSGRRGHRGSFKNLLGDKPDEQLLKVMSLETQVTQHTPPTFLWHTADDTVVPVENSLLFATALARYHVPFELHVYPQGPHGMGLAVNDAHVATWMPLCCEWLKGQGW